MRAVAPQIELLVDDVGVGLKGEPAPLDLRARPPVAHVACSVELEHRVDLGCEARQRMGPLGSGRRKGGSRSR